MMPRLRTDGFTLIELLVVLVILGLLAGVVAPNVIKYLGRAKTDTARVQIEQVQAQRRHEEGARVSLLRILLTPQTDEERNGAFLGQLADFVQGSLALYRQVDSNQMRLLAHVGATNFPENLLVTGEDALAPSEEWVDQTPAAAHQDRGQAAQSLHLHPIGHGSQVLRYLAATTTTSTQDDQERLDKLLAWSSRQLATTWISMDQRQRLARYAHEQEEQARLLAQTNQELERANRTKDDFLSTMSHELRTPLNAIIGFSEVLRDGLAGPMSPDQLDYTLEILRAGQHLLELINDILDLAKIEAGRMELDASPADIGELCQTVQRMVRERAANKNITLTAQSGAEVATKLMLDQRKVKQILLNLLSNAIKFTPAGGSIVLRCSKVDSQQILDHRFDPGFRSPPHAIAPGPYLELRVQDSGVGISLENLKRLFAPFEQLDSSLSRHYEGTGLGLSLVKRFAELHGGLVHVTSAPGEGSIFTVWLPWQEVRE
jgi:prepilin-type N-terminal cleavage/methylation domain-containing protein